MYIFEEWFDLNNQSRLQGFQIEWTGTGSTRFLETSQGSFHPSWSQMLAPFIFYFGVLGG
jgi:hypothetical protein